MVSQRPKTKKLIPLAGFCEMSLFYHQPVENHESYKIGEINEIRLSVLKIDCLKASICLMWLAIASTLVAGENKLINVTLACEHSPVPVKSKSDVFQFNWASVLSLWWLSRWGAFWLPRDLGQVKLEGPIKQPCLDYFSAKFMPSLSFSIFSPPCIIVLFPPSLPFSFCMHPWQ